VNVPPGFQPERVLTMRLNLNTAKYGSDAPKAVAGLTEILSRIQSIPGVNAAGSIHFPPLTVGSATGFYVAGQPIPGPGSEPVTAVSIVTPGYFRAMGIPLIKGRVLEDGDAAGKPFVTVVNQELARKYFPDVNPVGRKLFVQWGRQTPYEIVGVVGDVKHQGLDKGVMPALYFTYAQETNTLATLVVRTGADPIGIARTLQDRIHEFDKDQAIAEVQSLEEMMYESVARPRFQSILLGTFAGLALLLAAIGIFGVISYSVTQRTHEIGIRMALGAERNQVLRLVVGQGLTIALLGAAGGLAGAFALTHYLQALLFNVSPTDLATFVALPLFLCAVAVAASYVPARRAAKVDPISALRYE
jgi:putative ABC transport system permease protein